MTTKSTFLHSCFFKTRILILKISVITWAEWSDQTTRKNWKGSEADVADLLWREVASFLKCGYLDTDFPKHFFFCLLGQHWRFYIVQWSHYNHMLWKKSFNESWKRLHSFIHYHSYEAWNNKDETFYHAIFSFGKKVIFSPILFGKGCKTIVK